VIGAGYQSPPQPSLFLARIVRWIAMQELAILFEINRH
jgi:hypothetical protein